MILLLESETTDSFNVYPVYFESKLFTSNLSFVILGMNGAMNSLSSNFC
jgi:hypothetical protein